MQLATALRAQVIRLRERSFIAQAGALLTGAVVAQAVPVLLSPVLTRLYSPEDFAVFAIFMSVNGVIAVVAAGRYDEAILLPASDDDAINLVALAWLVLGVLCATLGVALAVLHGHIPDRWMQTLRGDWLPLLPLTLFICASFQILSAWNNRCTRFTKLATSRAAQGVLGGSGQCALGYAGLHGFELIWGWVLGYAGGLLMLLRVNLPSLWKGRAQVSRPAMATVAHRYRRFPLLSTWGCLLGNGGSMMALLIVSHSFSAAVTGLFSFTLRVLALPLFLISNALAQVLQQRIARLNNEDPSLILPYVLRSAAVLITIAIPFVILLAFAGGELFAFVFGADWAEAGEYARLLALAVGIRFVVSPLTAVLSLEHNVKSCTQWQTLYFLSVTLTLSLGSHLPIESFLKLYVAHEMVLYSIYFGVVIQGARRRPPA